MWCSHPISNIFWRQGITRCGSISRPKLKLDCRANQDLVASVLISILHNWTLKRLNIYVFLPKRVIITGDFSEVVFRLAVWLIPLRKSSLSSWRSQVDDLARWNWRNFMKMGIQNSLELSLWLKIDDLTSPSSSIEKEFTMSCPPRGSK